MGIVLAALLALAVLFLWALNILGLPGNWFVMALISCYAILVPDNWRIDISWWVLGVLFLTAVLGEVVELLAGALGAKKAGASRRSAAMAIGGSLIGGVLGFVIGIPVPFIGSVTGALLLGSLGAAGGAVLGEYSRGRALKQGVRVGYVAFWGRLLGSLGKMLVGAVMVGMILVALFV